MTEPVVGDPEAALRAFEQLPSAVVVHTGPEHVLTAANAAARRILGNRELIGRPVREAFSESGGRRWVELYDRMWATGEAVTGQEWHLQLRDDATGAGSEFFLNFTIAPIRDRDGTLVGSVSNAVDVTAEVTAREAARARAGEAEERYRAARDVVFALQGSLLPEYLPVLPGVRLAAHYLVAGDEQTAGGDWFDAVPLPGGRVALVVGDVVGHGARASAVMGQLRAVLTAFLLDGYGVVESLARLDRFVARVPSALATTVCLAVLDPATGEACYACCGHPPPLLLSASGSARYLAARPGVPLGTAGFAPIARTAALEPGDLLMLYTDGLVERPDRGLSAGLNELSACAGDALLYGPRRMAAVAEVDRVCRLTLDRMVRDGHHDDVSLIAAQRTAAVSSNFEVELPATVEALGELREGLDGWFATVGADEQDVRAVQLAVSEAVTNTIEHAYPGGAGTVRVEGQHDTSGRACMTVSDDGLWRPPSRDPNGRGRGLVMIRSCMDTTEIETTAAGTTVLMDRQLGHKAVFAASDAPDWTSGTAGASGHFGMFEQRSRGPRLNVRGPMDAATVPELGRRVQDSSRGGSLPLDIDLTEVSQLASAGVQLLHELAEQMAADGRTLRLIAPLSCPARAVLQLTGLDHLVVREAQSLELSDEATR